MSPTKTAPPKLGLTRDEAAAAVGLSRDAIDKAIHTPAGPKRLPAKKIGRAVRIKPADLEAWFDAQEDVD